jgi:hypothetical protein
MLLRCNLGNESRPYAVLYAAYLRNQTPSSTSGSVTPPYERLYGRVPTLGNLRIFGCLAYAKVPDKRMKKLFEKQSQFEQRCWIVSLECNTKHLTWIMATFTT